MAKVELIMPKMGESIMEATILNWVKNVGDTVEMDETILEIATDKVDSEIPSPADGTIIEVLYPADSVVEIGKVIAIIETDGDESSTESTPAEKTKTKSEISKKEEAPNKHDVPYTPQISQSTNEVESSEERFYSPLVRNIAKTEGISQAELDGINGSGKDGRVTKKDILNYVDNRSSQPSKSATQSQLQPDKSRTNSNSSPLAATSSYSGDHEIIEMDRMRKMIAHHMVNSVQTSPHVTSFVEADVTKIVNWRNKYKKEFQKKYGEKITFTPIFVEAIAKAIRDFPLINISVDGDNIIVKKDINIGMAAALPSGNLIVPVIKNADQLNLVGLAKQVNSLADKARNNKLKPDDIQGGTYTLTNVGTFGNVLGTPIINQPQVAILAAGAIVKKPAVLETPDGDVIAIRHKMFLSHSYDHRVVDGALGGKFVRKVADYLEDFDDSQTI